MSGYFITGTDTGVGKTLVAAALVVALMDRGRVVAPMKPVAAGLDPHGVNEDVALLAELTGHRFPRHAVNPYGFKEAIAPHIAARREGVAPDMQVIVQAYKHLADRADCVVVEGAGGFLVPMNDAESMSIIPSALGLPVILVVGMRLGCLNHALLTAEAIRARGLALAGWVANTPGETMSAYADNLATLRALLPAPWLGEIPHLAGMAPLSAARLAARCLLIDSLETPA